MQEDLVVRGDPDAVNPPVLLGSRSQSPGQADLFSFFIANDSSRASAIIITLRRLHGSCSCALLTASCSGGVDVAACTRPGVRRCRHRRQRATSCRR